MSIKRAVIEATLASAVADAGTVAVTYPTGFQKGDALFGGNHSIMLNGNKLNFPNDFTISFAAGTATITNKTGASWAAGSKIVVQINGGGDIQVFPPGTEVKRASKGKLILIDLGSPATLDVDGIAAAQAVADAANLTLNGALAVSGAVTLDVPRAVVVDSTDAGDTTQTLTVKGTDEYGNALWETIASNGTTAVNGKKAFKTITSIAASAAYAGNVTVGTTDILGLPIAVRGAGQIVNEIQDLAIATAGTFVAASAVEATATSADVRGTYLPNAAADGAKAYQLLVYVPDIDDLGGVQYAGTAL